MLRYPQFHLLLLLFTLIFSLPSVASETPSTSSIPSTTIFGQGTAYITTPKEKYSFSIEIASNRDQWSQGLMYRKHMDEMAGMLFLFPKEKVYSMWMKNTYIPLDMLFIRKDGSIALIAKNTTPESYTSISSSEAVFYVLELNAGMTEKLGIKPGDVMTFDPYTPKRQQAK